jgi:putative membrane protein
MECSITHFEIYGDEPSNRVHMIPSDNSTRLAADRTRLALERTLMAWVRTAISLITFGFGFYKAAQLVSAEHPVPQSWLGPRQFGLIMILLGLLTLILGTREHHVEMLQLQAEFPSRLRRSPARLLAIVVAVLGLSAVFSMIFRG